MTWMQVHDSVRDHPKILKLAKRLQISQAETLGHVVALWTWTQRMAPDGELSSFDEEDIEGGALWTGDEGHFVEAAVDVKLIDQGQFGYAIHDWMDYSGSFQLAHQKREQRARKRGESPPLVVVGDCSRRSSTERDPEQRTRKPTHPEDREEGGEPEGREGRAGGTYKPKDDDVPMEPPF